MVGAAGMSPLPIELNGKTFADETEEQTRDRIMKRFEDIGSRLMNRTATQATGDPTGASQRPAEARLRRPVHRRGVRDRLQPHPGRTGRRSRLSPTRSSRRRRSTETTSCGSSTSSTSCSPRSTGPPTRPGRKLMNCSRSSEATDRRGGRGRSGAAVSDLSDTAVRRCRAERDMRIRGRTRRLTSSSRVSPGTRSPPPAATSGASSPSTRASASSSSAPSAAFVVILVKPGHNAGAAVVGLEARRPARRAR